MHDQRRLAMAPAMWECRYKKEKRNKRNENIQKEKRTGISECYNKNHAIVAVPCCHQSEDPNPLESAAVLDGKLKFTWPIGGKAAGNVHIGSSRVHISLVHSCTLFFCCLDGEI